MGKTPSQPKKKAAKPPKKRADKYEQKLTINGSFEELVKELITPKLITKK